MFVILASLVFASSPASAADKPENGPVPYWVKPVSQPTSATVIDAAPFHMLLQDQQWRFHGETTDLYTATAVRIDKAEGLASVGNIAIQWKPDTDRVIVHALRIVRGKEVIDVLAGGHKFIILQRENNLELAMIDGVLTASLSLEGLRVGDNIEFAYTIERSEPLLAGHHGIVLDAGTQGSIGRLAIAGQWDVDRPVSMRSRNLPAEPISRPASMTLQAYAVGPLVQPQRAPARFLLGRLLEFSDYRGWGDVSTIFTPLFDTARKLQPNSPLNGEIARIKAVSPDPAIRAGMALKLVQDDVRYLYVGLNQSNLKPVEADATWKRRFGDCKAKTALLLALLDGLGIKAEAALVSVSQGDGLDQRLPSVSLFDHVIVRATIGARIYWLDGTRIGDRSLASLHVPDLHWALPLHPGSNKLEPLTVGPADTPNMIYSLRLDASKGVLVPAPAHGEMIIQGDAAQYTHRMLAAIPRVQQENGLRNVWRKKYDFITPERLSEHWQEASGTETLIMDGMAKMDWNVGSTPRYYEMDGSVVGWNGDYHRDAGPDREAPFTVEYPEYAEARETVILPNGGSAFTIEGEDIDETIAQRALYRRSERKGNLVTMVARQKPLAAELSYPDAQSAKDRLRELSKRSVYINIGESYTMTPDDMNVAAVWSGTTEADFHVRLTGLAYLANGSGILAEAKRYSAAFPKSADALAAIAQAQAINGHKAEALAAAAQSLAIDPNENASKAVRAYYSWADSVGADKALSFQASLLLTSAQSCRNKGNLSCSLALIDRAIAHFPTENSLYLERANIYGAMNKQDDRARQADLMIAAAPHNADVRAVAGVIYCSTGQCAKGLKAFGDSIAIKPNVIAYINRIRYLPATDQAARRRDIDAALKLEPTNNDVLVALAKWQHDNKDVAGEAATLASVKVDTSATFDAAAKIRLAAAYVQAGQADKARSTFAEVRGYAAGTRDGRIYNSICYGAATIGFELDTALADCRLAVALNPESAAILDSLGFVELRLGNYGDAIAAYNKSLALIPGPAPITRGAAPMLYGRGMAKARNGDRVGGNADISAAIKADPEIVATFRAIGIAP